MGWVGYSVIIGLVSVQLEWHGTWLNWAWQYSSQGVSKAFHGYFLGVLKMFQRCFKMKVPRMIDWCSEDVSWVFLGCLKVVKKGRSKQVLFLSYFVSFALLQIFQCFLCIFCTFLQKYIFLQFWSVFTFFWHFYLQIIGKLLTNSLQMDNKLWANCRKIIDKFFA